MKAAAVALVLALVLVGTAKGGGGRLVELVERVGLLEAADVDHDAAVDELEDRVVALELATLRLRSRVACLEWKAAGRPPGKASPCPRRLPR